jgi:hypothetical protein
LLNILFLSCLIIKNINHILFYLFRDKYNIVYIYTTTMAISPEQRAILIERLKKAQEAKKAKAEARKAEAEKAPKVKAEPKPKAEPKAKAKPDPKPAPVAEPVPEPEPPKEESESEEVDLPKATPVVQEIYHKDKKGTFVEITASERPPWGDPETLKKRAPSKPIDIPPPKPTKDKGYMKLKFYKEPSQKVLKKIMKIHDESSSSEEEEEEEATPPPVRNVSQSQADAKKTHMKELAKFYFDYY